MCTLYARVLPRFASSRTYLRLLWEVGAYFCIRSQSGVSARKVVTSPYDRLYMNVRRQLHNNRKSYCTTFVDYYGLDSSFPGVEAASTMPDLSAKAKAVADGLVAALSKKIDQDPLLRFIPYIQMHEFEALMFSDPVVLCRRDRAARAAKRSFADIREKFETPEHIDDSLVTAPSKRILALYSEYEKPLMGETVAKAIGLPKIRQECPLFNAWLAKLETLPPLAA